MKKSITSNHIILSTENRYCIEASIKYDCYIGVFIHRFYCPSMSVLRNRFDYFLVKFEILVPVHTLNETITSPSFVSKYRYVVSVRRFDYSNFFSRFVICVWIVKEFGVRTVRSPNRQKKKEFQARSSRVTSSTMCVCVNNPHLPCHCQTRAPYWTSLWDCFKFLNRSRGSITWTEADDSWVVSPLSS